MSLLPDYVSIDGGSEFKRVEPPKATKPPRPRHSDPRVLTGPKLKIARAKRHLTELVEMQKAFFEAQPYTLVGEVDPKTGDQVIRVKVHKCLPTEMTVVIGDVVHNLRSALDQLVCELILANNKQIRSGNGFPVGTSEKKFAEAIVGKLKGVSSKSERFIRRLKPFAGGNNALWLLHELDAMDKHTGIIPIAMGKVQIQTHIHLPFSFTEDGRFMLGRGPMFVGIPVGFEPAPLKDNAEIYRIPSGVNQQIQAIFEIALGKSKVFSGGEIINELLIELIVFVERVMGIAETHLTLRASAGS